MTARGIQAILVGVAVWAGANALLLGVGNLIVPVAHTRAVPIFLVTSAALITLAAWLLSSAFQHKHGTEPPTRMLFAVSLAGVGLLLDGLLVGGFGGSYPQLAPSRQPVLAGGLYLGYAALIAGSLLPMLRPRRIPSPDRTVPAGGER